METNIDNDLAHPSDLMPDTSQKKNEKQVRKPRQKRSIESKNQIIKASLELFSKKGYHKSTTNEISAYAGVSIGCLYSYFSDKHNIFLEVLKYYNENYNANLNNRLIKIDAYKYNKTEFVEEIIKCIVDTHRTFKEFYKELMIMRLADPDVAKIMSAQYELNLRNALKFLQYWKDEMIVEDMDAALVTIFYTVHNLVDTIILSRSPIEDERIIKSTTRMILKYLGLC